MGLNCFILYYLRKWVRVQHHELMQEYGTISDPSSGLAHTPGDPADENRFRRLILSAYVCMGIGTSLAMLVLVASLLDISNTAHRFSQSLLGLRIGALLATWPIVLPVSVGGAIVAPTMFPRDLDSWTSALTAWNPASAGVGAMWVLHGLSIAGIALAAMAFMPILLTLAMMGSRLAASVRAGSRVKRRQHDFQSAIDSITRPDLYGELAKAVKGPIDVRFSQAGLVAIEDVGFTRPRFVLWLGLGFLETAREPLEREALIWHEVGHAHVSMERVESRLPLRLLLGYWRPPAESAASDSYHEEHQADAFASSRTGVQGREALQDILSRMPPAPSDPHRPSSYQTLLQVLAGNKDIWHWHPAPATRVIVRDNSLSNAPEQQANKK